MFSIDSRLFSKIEINSSFGRFPAVMRISLYGSLFRRNEFRKSLSLLTTILCSFMEIMLTKSSSVRFFSGSSNVCMQSYPFSFNQRASRLGKFASIINLFKRLSCECFLLLLALMRKSDRLECLPFRGLHNQQEFLHWSSLRLKDQASILPNSGGCE